MKRTVIFIMFGLFTRLFAAAPADPMAFIDDYLTRLDRFAQGDNTLRHGVGADAERFYDQLTEVLHANDKRAASRLVFSVVVKIVATIPVESRLGREAIRVMGPLPTTKEEGKDVIFAGEFYFWWKAKRADYPAFPLLDQWEIRDFTRENVIPLFEQLHSAKRKKG